MKRLYLGIVVFSLSIGLLIGSSNTPVVGAFISAIFGLVVGAITFLASKENSKIKINPLQVGNLLIGFTFPLMIGVSGGVYYRTSEVKQEKKLPWSASNQPQSTYEALDWISVTEILSQKGYTDNEITALYNIRVNETKKSDSLQVKYSETYPYYKMLSPLLEKSNEDKKTGRGPASEN